MLFICRCAGGVNSYKPSAATRQNGLELRKLLTEGNVVYEDADYQKKIYAGRWQAAEEGGSENAPLSTRFVQRTRRQQLLCVCIYVVSACVVVCLLYTACMHTFPKARDAIRVTFRRCGLAAQHKVGVGWEDVQISALNVLTDSSQ